MRSVLTVVETCYHQREDSQPTSAVTRYCVTAGDEEQVYARQMTLKTAEWTAIDVGWFRGRSASLLLLANQEGVNLHTIPTVVQKAEIAARIVELAFSPAGPTALTVPPGESCRFRPADLASIYARVQGGPARVTLTLFP